MDTIIKEDLAYAYRFFARLGMDDLTYTHISARSGSSDSYFIYPFGLLYEEVTPKKLLNVDFEGNILEGSEFQYNRTGYIIHGNIYVSRPDIKAIFHYHTPASVAVSAMKSGLMPISQWALHFYNQVAYLPYDSLALDYVLQGNGLLEALGDKKVMLMENHGALTCGATIQEAFFYAYHLEKACQTQCLALQSGQELILPSEEICKRANRDLLGFEKDLGRRDWEALRRTEPAFEKESI